ncbi:hypothetical protein CRT23_26980 [Methylobacterium sp. V23]|nr:hypothetical protein CRT23_26980 [Methylobacterium sp. V23]
MTCENGIGRDRQATGYTLDVGFTSWISGAIRVDGDLRKTVRSAFEFAILIRQEKRNIQYVFVS